MDKIIKFFRTTKEEGLKIALEKTIGYTKGKFRKNKAWQYQRHIEDKFNLIKPILDEQEVNSVLDVGCNAGQITRLAGDNDFFAVGVEQSLENIDLKRVGFEQALDNACIGNIELDLKKIEKLPLFDAILLLSVHHQLVSNFGENWAKKFVSKLFRKSNKVLIMEFAALNRKYGYEKQEDLTFKNNDESSIVPFAKNWLLNTLPNAEVDYVGKAPHHKINVKPQNSSEPYRYIFSAKKK